MKEELKPCPFCGCKAEIDRICSVNETEYLEYLVRCSKCGVSMLANSEEITVSSWNTRKLLENNPLTLDEVKSLKCSDVVWLKDEYGLRAIEYSHIHNSKYGESIYYYMFDVEGLEGYALDYLDKSFSIYRNKPEIADISRKDEI